MSEIDKIEGKLPLGIIGSRVPSGVRRSGEYLEKVEVSGGAIYLLSRHVDYEMSRIELTAKARFVVTPQVAAHQSFYLLTGELVCLERSVLLEPGSSFKVKGNFQRFRLEALCRTTLLYFSTANDFYAVGESLERA